MNDIIISILRYHTREMGSCGGESPGVPEYEYADVAEEIIASLTIDEVAFPSSEEAKVILGGEGIDTTELKSWASGKLSEIKSRLPGIGKEVGA